MAALALATSNPLTEAGRKTQRALYYFAVWSVLENKPVTPTERKPDGLRTRLCRPGPLLDNSGIKSLIRTGANKQEIQYNALCSGGIGEFVHNSSSLFGKNESFVNLFKGSLNEHFAILW